ncbi:hypothetical protein [Sporosarcina beigongshangi]|uniref:hypothetical protein n=1 Tax=Sporosarcina beigongshangi TaxID=2782538 RepID=UPI00193AA104|nr:hypothetical protein [Sporosarcina beigongshangi]
MNSITSDKKTGLLLLGLLTVALLAAVYYYLVNPLSEEKQRKEVNISSLHSEIDTMQGQIAVQGTEETSEESLFLLRKKLPGNRELDKLIRSIQEIEFVSDSQIEAITFNNYDETVAESNLIVPDTEVDSENIDEASSEQSEEGQSDVDSDDRQVEMPVSPVADTSLPEQLKLLTFSIDVKTKNFEALQHFLKEVEGLERIVRIDAVEFSLPGEEQEFNIESTDSIGATVQLTTFFYLGE